LRYTRVKDVGTRNSPADVNKIIDSAPNTLHTPNDDQKNDKRYKRIIEIATPVLDDCKLPSRTIYWFVATREAAILSTDKDLFERKETNQVIDEGVTYYLYQIHFKRMRSGLLTFQYMDGKMDIIKCVTTPAKSTSNKRLKSDSSNSQLSPTVTDNNYIIAPDASQPSSMNREMVVDYDLYFTNTAEQQLLSLNNVTHIGEPVQSAPSSSYMNWLEIQPPALITNILLLIPDEDDCIHMIESALTSIGLKKEVSSSNRQNLYSATDEIHRTRHVLVLPYGRTDRFLKIQDCLRVANETIVLLVNGLDQPDNIMVVTKVTNIHVDHFFPDSTWKLTTKAPGYKHVELDFLTQNTTVQTLFSVSDLHTTTVGAVSCKKLVDYHGLNESMATFLIRWTVSPVTRIAPQCIYLCFKHEPKRVTTFTEVANAALLALGIDFEPVWANGSILIYLRCPSYIPWYILHRKKDIFNVLSVNGLTEIYECFISDVEESMQRPDNDEFVDDLNYLKEQMISDGISEQPTQNR